MKSGEFQSSGVIQSLFEDTYDNFFQSQDGHMKASHGHLRHPEKILMSDDFPVATLNALAPGKYGSSFKSTIFKLIIENCILGIHCEITLGCTLQNLTDEKSTLDQILAWCCQATSQPEPMLT